ncbi:hypothetical protein BDK51DRAFT_47682 [Blyttiomyces helicus]|uniref:Uncharacterized protein n=1 Tax=Blyttiomyces helicus TaxID=388810 RepID=A0A4V1IQ89_9FUNG|nr:hypothetical protein BDK51DRAFT_47682 [Blyttiomyces helicus]|eukprot:RKO85717.1 hypothetical protein BDK51DRAFT_47682 [Blyttiomyces helicus]
MGDNLENAEIHQRTPYTDIGHRTSRDDQGTRQKRSEVGRTLTIPAWAKSGRSLPESTRAAVSDTRTSLSVGPAILEFGACDWPTPCPTRQHPGHGPTQLAHFAPFASLPLRKENQKGESRRSFGFVSTLFSPHPRACPHAPSHAFTCKTAEPVLSQNKYTELDPLCWSQLAYAQTLTLDLDPARDTLARIDYHRISETEFIERVERPAIPAVIAGAIDGWKAREDWTIEVRI